MYMYDIVVKVFNVFSVRDMWYGWLVMFGVFGSILFFYERMRLCLLYELFNINYDLLVFGNWVIWEMVLELKWLCIWSRSWIVGGWISMLDCMNWLIFGVVCMIFFVFIFEWWVFCILRIVYVIVLIMLYMIIIL